MNRRRVATVLGGVLGIAFFIALMYWLQTTRPRIDAEAFAQLEAGMTPEEVRAILGRPHNASDGHTIAWRPRDGKRVSFEVPPGPDVGFLQPDTAKGEREQLWVTTTGLIAVVFDADGRLREKYYSDVFPPDGVLTKVQRWFER